MLNILIVEDDVTIRELLSYNLKNNFKILEANSAEEAMEVCEHNNIHLILLDWMLPEMSGLSFLRTIKKQKNNSEIPVIFVTAREDEKDKIAGLTSGADDYIAKPFSPRELVSRVKAILRRTSEESMKEVIFAGALKLNQLNRRVNIGDTLVSLGPTEYKLLQFFLTHQDRVYTRDQILDNVWGRNVYLDERTVDVHIRRLRKAISIAGYENYVQTVRGAGYRFSIRLDKST